MAAYVKDQALEAIATQLGFDDEPTAGGGYGAPAKWDAGWRPRLHKTQRKGYEDKVAKYILFDGERGTGKTVGALHKLAEHCFLNRNAIAAVVVREAGQAKDGGAWDKLLGDIIPQWQTGNINPKTGEKYDNGIGLEIIGPRMDNETKKQFLWIRNRFGAWCRIVCFSLPVGAHVEDKIKGKEFSFLLVDEAQTTEDEAYFTHLIQQVGRRHGITGPQQIVYCANPDGPSHWLYNRFFVIPMESGVWNPDYARYHIPITENIAYLPDGYYDNVIEACRHDKIMFRRLVKGEWIDRPTGTSIFVNSWDNERHIKGDINKGTGIIPIKGLPIVLGYDLGPAHSSVTFEQNVVGHEFNLWTIFDEVNCVDEYLPYHEVVPKILARMKYWCDRLEYDFSFIHISDNSAFNQLRPDGSYDATKVEELSEGKIRLIECPKYAGSVAERVSMFMNMLGRDELMVSAIAEKHILMFNMLESERPKRGQYEPDLALKPRRSPHLHPFDSASYPPFYYKVGGHGIPESKRQAESSIVVCGQPNRKFATAA